MGLVPFRSHRHPQGAGIIGVEPGLQLGFDGCRDGVWGGVQVRGSGRHSRNLGALGWTLDPEHLGVLSQVSAPLSRGIGPHQSLWGWHSRG